MALEKWYSHPLKVAGPPETATVLSSEAGRLLSVLRFDSSGSAPGSFTVGIISQRKTFIVSRKQG
jgi:hypothetical protein